MSQVDVAVLAESASQPVPSEWVPKRCTKSV